MSSFLRSHTWKRFRRSPLFGRNMAEGGLKMFFGLYFAMMFLVTSTTGGFLLQKLYPDIDVVHSGGAIILYYFICSLVMRYIFQKFDGMQIKPYLHLPIKESKITNYLLNKSFLDFFNLFPLLLMLPFMLVSVLPAVSMVTFFGLLLFFIGIVFVNHFTTYLLSKGQSRMSNWLLILIPVLILVIYWDYKYGLGLLKRLSAFVATVIDNPWIMPIPAIIAALLYFKVRTDLHHNINDFNSVKSSGLYGTTFELPFLQKHGLIGSIIQLEINLVIRSKRARQYAYTSVFMLLYPLFLLGGTEIDEHAIMIFCALFVAGAFSLNYGTFLFAWNSNHFDLILSQVPEIRDYIKAKIYLLSASTVLFTIIGLPYLFLNAQFYVLVLAVGLFGLSGIPMIYILFSLYNSKKIDPNEGGAFSTSGMGVMHFVIMIPVMIIPILIFYGGNALLGTPWGIICIAVTGMICLLLMGPFINWAATLFRTRKYSLSEAFREQ